ncbi:hypothetical protein [Prauserella aidingensis]|uniref:hypothetical protein n=1 Tax=Prauserella aidingensis TaxID=387890 RepID=UPI0020A4D836|nr:hypothetical protein [Prauserella aidingensis]
MQDEHRRDVRQPYAGLDEPEVDADDRDSSSSGRSVSIDAVCRAEHALYRRTAVAFTAAMSGRLHGTFRTWTTSAGLMVALATHPALHFLSTISGVTADTAPHVAHLLETFGQYAAVPTVVAAPSFGDSGSSSLRAVGLVPADDRVLAVRDLAAGTNIAVAEPSGSVTCEAAEAGEFLGVLLPGYEVEGVVGAFIAAEHRDPAVRRSSPTKAPCRSARQR